MEALTISNDEYRAMDGISSTEIKRMSKSMAHYKYYKDNPQEETQALLFGKAYHKYCLEPSTFFEEFAVAPVCDRRTKDGKEIYAYFLKDNIGKDIISNDDYETICAMRDALYATPFAKKLMYGEHEKSFFWKDERSGLKCKCRPDSYGKIGDRHICVDLKTCTNAETQAFMRDAIKFGYDIQASHYTQGLKATFGEDFDFVFIAQEKAAPYAVNILQADEYFMQSGAQLRDTLLEQYIECTEKGVFPAYITDEINTLGVPKWIADTLGGVADE